MWTACTPKALPACLPAPMWLVCAHCLHLVTNMASKPFDQQHVLCCVLVTCPYLTSSPIDKHHVPCCVHMQVGVQRASRPNMGQAGRQITISANHFPMRLKGECMTGWHGTWGLDGHQDPDS